MKIAIGNDHAGTEYKNAIVHFLEKNGHEVVNCGTNSNDSVDYPDFAHQVAKRINNVEADLGVLLCGTGNGVAITANKHPKVRAGLAWTKEIAAIIKQHNNANILVIPARFTSQPQAVAMVESFLNTDFEGGRHQRRIDKIPC